MKALRTLMAAGVLTFSVVADAGAAPGYLAQKVGTAGCVWQLVAAPCAHGRALDAPASVVISPDGHNAYVASSTSGLATYDRAPDGTLSQRPGPSGCTSALSFGDPIVDGCGRGRALDGATSVAISPGGRSVYVASFGSHAVAVFDRAPDGALTQKPGTAGCVSDTGTGPCADGTALDFPHSVAVSADDRSVYVSSSGNSNAVAVFDRAPDGALVQKPGTAGCVSSTAEGVRACARSTTLGDASSVTISPDGRSVYATSQAVDGAVTSFDRAPNGTLTQKRGAAGCISGVGAGACRDGEALYGAASVTVGPDGTSAYVASTDGIAVFDRAADGTLTQKPGGAGCFSQPKIGRCTKTTGLRGAGAVTVSPGGENVYATSDKAVVVFDRAPDGTLSQKPGTQGCISDSGAGPCVRGAALADAESVTVSPDGNNAYVASFTSRGLAIFDRLATMPPAPAPDTAKPLLTGLEIFPSSFRAGSVRPTKGFRRDSLHYILSEPASVRFTMTRVVRGRPVGGRCARPRRPAGRTTSCSRYASVRGAFTDLGETGDNYPGFKGRLLDRRLPPGRYRLRVIATDVAGNASAPKHAGFRVIRGRRGRRP